MKTLTNGFGGGRYGGSVALASEDPELDVWNKGDRARILETYDSWTPVYQKALKIETVARYVNREGN